MAMADEQTPRQITAVLFDDFELLDVFGPLELFGVLPDKFRISLIGPTRGPVASAPGPQAVADHSYHDAPVADIVLVPGGIGTRQLVSDRAFLRWLAEWASRAELVASVCTGSGVLAAAGLQMGATSTMGRGWRPLDLFRGGSRHGHGDRAHRSSARRRGRRDRGESGRTRTPP